MISRGQVGQLFVGLFGDTFKIVWPTAPSLYVGLYRICKNLACHISPNVCLSVYGQVELS